jgi:hypothetical protein
LGRSNAILDYTGIRALSSGCELSCNRSVRCVGGEESPYSLLKPWARAKRRARVSKRQAGCYPKIRELKEAINRVLN